MSRRLCCAVISLLLIFAGTSLADDTLPIVEQVEAQPLAAQAKRIAQALQFLGQPLTDKQQQAFDAALAESDPAKRTAAIQKVFNGLCLAGVNINPESRVKVARGPAAAKLMENGWTVFLVRVHNEAGVTAPLRVTSPNAAPLYQRSTGSPDPKPSIRPDDVPNRWLDLQTHDKQPLVARLSGLECEYRIVQLYSRAAGKREAKLLFDIGQGTQDIGFRNELPVLFVASPAVAVKLEVIDHDGKPTTGQFVIRDPQGRVYPARTRRLAPDFFFHDQIYRHHGETVLLPPGEFQVRYTRGPEYVWQQRTINVPDAKEHRETFRLKRWIKLTDHRWYSGDHHVHAAGCSHYEAPTEGVTPEAMMRHILGEDLNVGCVLSWGPCWYHQKQFFDGQTHKLSRKNYLMRYDVEVSGFPSSHAGHLCLLRLTEDDYPSTTKIEEWPSWDLPVLKWGKEQGAVVGFSHSGWGLQCKSTDLPNYEMPKFDGIGANEYIVDVTHDVCDFISAVDTPIIWELNIWYHTLNCGYDCRISGETDFPCIYGDRVGLGRIYVKLDEDQELNYDNWVFGLRDGRSYCGDGLSHLIDFSINGLEVGNKGDKDRPSVLAIDKGKKLEITAQAAALLAEEPNNDIRNRPLNQKPYWHVERARQGESRQVRVELVVNGEVEAHQDIEATGDIHDVKFNYTPEQSSWVAMRIFPTCHTNPIFVEVDGQPIRASKKSAQWCLDAVDVCWNSKKGRIRESEREEAKAAYEHAKAAYRKILAATKSE